MRNYRWYPGMVLAALAGLTACGQDQPPTTEPTAEPKTQTSTATPVASIALSNAVNRTLTDEPYYLSFDEMGLNRESALSMDLGATVDGAPVATQLIDRDGDGQKDGLLTLVNLPSAGTIELIIDRGLARQAPEVAKRTQAEISHKVGGEWQPHSDENREGMYEYVGGEFENVDRLTPPEEHSDHSYYIRYEGCWTPVW